MQALMELETQMEAEMTQMPEVPKVFPNAKLSLLSVPKPDRRCPTIRRLTQVP